ncbi:unnamed protein product [Trichobilharzia regenti]|nr:unnamed protein product [Trichobilharzia regenti]
MFTLPEASDLPAAYLCHPNTLSSSISLRRQRIEESDSLDGMIVTDTCDDVFTKQKNKHLRSKSHTRDESKAVVDTVIEEQSSTSLQNESVNSMDIVDTIKVQLMLKTFRSCKSLCCFSFV